MGWITIRNCEIDEVYQKLPTSWNQYMIIVKFKKEGENFPCFHRIIIQDSRIIEHLERLLAGKTEREYFAFGMQDIDVFKLNDVFGIDHSPVSGVHHVFILKKGELEKLVMLLKCQQPAMV